MRVCVAGASLFLLFTQGSCTVSNSGISPKISWQQVRAGPKLYLAGTGGGRHGLPRSGNVCRYGAKRSAYASKYAAGNSAVDQTVSSVLEEARTAPATRSAQDRQRAS